MLIDYLTELKYKNVKVSQEEFNKSKLMQMSKESEPNKKSLTCFKFT